MNQASENDEEKRDFKDIPRETIDIRFGELEKRVERELAHQKELLDVKVSSVDKIQKQIEEKFTLFSKVSNYGIPIILVIIIAIFYSTSKPIIDTAVNSNVGPAVKREVEKSVALAVSDQVPVAIDKSIKESVPKAVDERIQKEVPVVVGAAVKEKSQAFDINSLIESLIKSRLSEYITIDLIAKSVDENTLKSIVENTMKSPIFINSVIFNKIIEEKIATELPTIIKSELSRTIQSELIKSMNNILADSRVFEEIVLEETAKERKKLIAPYMSYRTVYIDSRKSLIDSIMREMEKIDPYSFINKNKVTLVFVPYNDDAFRFEFHVEDSDLIFSYERNIKRVQKYRLLAWVRDSRAAKKEVKDLLVKYIEKEIDQLGWLEYLVKIVKREENWNVLRSNDGKIEKGILYFEEKNELDEYVANKIAFLLFDVLRRDLPFDSKIKIEIENK